MPNVSMTPLWKRLPSMPRWLRRRAGDGAESGVSLVELALAMPILLLIMLGTIDLGRLYFDYIELRSAVVDGAVYAARNPTDTAGAIAETIGTGVPPDTSVSVAITGDCSTMGGGGKATVTATSTFVPVTAGFLSRFGLSSVTLRANSTMRCMT